MEKYFISANELLLDSFKLAEQVYARNFRPHFIIGVWRGGAPIGIAVQEYFDVMGETTDHIAIRASSYYGIDQQHKTVKIHGLDYILKNVESEQELLIVDDVFDSGRTIQAIIETIKTKAKKNSPKSIKTACTWYKPSRNMTNLTPDFYVHATEKWLVFPHEIKDLTREEVIKGKGSEIADIIFRNQRK